MDVGAVTLVATVSITVTVLMGGVAGTLDDEIRDVVLNNYNLTMLEGNYTDGNSTWDEIDRDKRIFNLREYQVKLQTLLKEVENEIVNIQSNDTVANNVSYTSSIDLRLSSKSSNEDYNIWSNSTLVTIAQGNDTKSNLSNQTDTSMTLPSLTESDDNSTTGASLETSPKQSDSNTTLRVEQNTDDAVNSTTTVETADDEAVQASNDTLELGNLQLPPSMIFIPTPLDHHNFVGLHGNQSSSSSRSFVTGRFIVPSLQGVNNFRGFARSGSRPIVGPQPQNYESRLWRVDTFNAQNQGTNNNALLAVGFQPDVTETNLRGDTASSYQRGPINRGVSVKSNIAGGNYSVTGNSSNPRGASGINIPTTQSPSHSLRSPGSNASNKFTGEAESQNNMQVSNVYYPATSNGNEPQNGQNILTQQANNNNFNNLGSHKLTSNNQRPPNGSKNDNNISTNNTNISKQHGRAGEFLSTTTTSPSITPGHPTLPPTTDQFPVPKFSPTATPTPGSPKFTTKKEGFVSIPTAVTATTTTPYHTRSATTYSTTPDATTSSKKTSPAARPTSPTAQKKSFMAMGIQTPEPETDSKRGAPKEQNSRDESYENFRRPDNIFGGFGAKLLVNSTNGCLRWSKEALIQMLKEKGTYNPDFMAWDVNGVRRFLAKSVIDSYDKGNQKEDDHSNQMTLEKNLESIEKMISELDLENCDIKTPEMKSKLYNITSGLRSYYRARFDDSPPRSGARPPSNLPSRRHLQRRRQRRENSLENELYGEDFEPDLKSEFESFQNSFADFQRRDFVEFDGSRSGEEPENSGDHNTRRLLRKLLSEFPALRQRLKYLDEQFATSSSSSSASSSSSPSMSMGPSPKMTKTGFDQRLHDASLSSESERRRFGGKKMMSSPDDKFDGDDNSVIGQVHLFECEARGTATEGFLRMCGACRAIRVMPHRFFPPFINEVVCDEDRGCMYFYTYPHGKCKQKFLNFIVLENIGTDDCQIWRKFSLNVRVCCECFVDQMSFFSKYI